MGPFLVVVGMLLTVGWILFDLNKKKGMPRGAEEYQTSLRHLQSNPASPELRERALRLGRVYANLTRNKNGETSLDEAALQNELDAACASAASNPVP